jgi:hypothetical protein
MSARRPTGRVNNVNNVNNCGNPPDRVSSHSSKNITDCLFRRRVSRQKAGEGVRCGAAIFPPHSRRVSSPRTHHKGARAALHPCSAAILWLLLPKAHSVVAAPLALRNCQTGRDSNIAPKLGCATRGSRNEGHERGPFLATKSSASNPRHVVETSLSRQRTMWPEFPLAPPVGFWENRFYVYLSGGVSYVQYVGRSPESTKGTPLVKKGVCRGVGGPARRAGCIPSRTVRVLGHNTPAWGDTYVSWAIHRNKTFAICIVAYGRHSLVRKRPLQHVSGRYRAMRAAKTARAARPVRGGCATAGRRVSVADGLADQSNSTYQTSGGQEGQNPMPPPRPALSGLDRWTCPPPSALSYQSMLCFLNRCVLTVVSTAGVGTKYKKMNSCDMRRSLSNWTAPFSGPAKR